MKRHVYLSYRIIFLVATGVNITPEYIRIFSALNCCCAGDRSKYYSGVYSAINCGVLLQDLVSVAFAFLIVFAKVRFSKCTSLKIVPKAAFAVHFLKKECLRKYVFKNVPAFRIKN